MLTTNTALQTILNAAPTKASWSSSVVQALSSSRKLSIFHDVNSGSDPATSGIEVVRCPLVGDMTISGGNISSFGKATDSEVMLAADLTVGTAVLRITSGSQWIQGSIGLTESAQLALGIPQAQVKTFDFTLPANPTAASGIGFGGATSIQAPIFLPSGTGPAAPEITANSVVAFRLITYPNGVDPVVAGVASMTQRDPDLVMDHLWMAAEYGDVRIMRCPDNTGVVMGTGGDCYRFSGTVLHLHAGANSEANAPLNQVKINAVPHNRWNNFPFRGNLDTAYDTLIPGPHKIELLRADGSVADVIEMYSTRDANNTPGSGKPVNFIGQTVNPKNGQPCQAFWTCQMVHEWWSHRPKYFSKVDHLIPGVTDDAMYLRNVTEFTSQIQTWPVFTEHQQYPGLDCWSLAPKWSRPYGAGFDTTIISPHWVRSEAIRDNYQTQVIGYGFEPGSTCGHTWYMAPGGSRHDRAPWPSTVIAWVTQKEGTRAHGAVPYKEMLHHWNMGYMNHGGHYFTNLERGLGIPKSKVLNGEICYNDTYYRGTQENFRPDLPNNAVRILASPSKSALPVDKNGKFFTNEYSRDYMHTQSTAAVGAYTYISPSHVLEARHSFTSHVLAAFALTRGMPYDSFLTREHAWHMWQMVNMWIVGNSDPRGFSCAEIENFTRKHLEATYDTVWPLYTSPTDIYGKSLRVLGITARQTDNTTTGMSNIGLITDSKAFYLGQVFLLWKQTGFFGIMKSKSQKCSDILDLMINCLGRFSVDFFIDANGRPDQIGYGYFWPIGTEPKFTSWADLSPPLGLADWLRKEDGSLTTRTPDEVNTMHFRAQFVHILRDYFPEYNFPRVDQAATIVDNFYKVIADGVQNGTSYRFKYRFPMMGVFKKAAKIGAPI